MRTYHRKYLAGQWHLGCCDCRVTENVYKVKPIHVYRINITLIAFFPTKCVLS
jgi:hypothetical protein